MHGSLILTHPGGAHKDEFLACAVLAFELGLPIERREPGPSDLLDPGIWVVDVGESHDEATRNFDHHQFPADAAPICALSLVLQHLGWYEEARLHFEWLETSEWLDARGPIETSRWLGVDREILSRLNSPVDLSLLRRFARAERLAPGDPLWEIMRMVGEDMLDYLKTLRRRLEEIGQQAEFWATGQGEVLFLPRTEPLPPEPSVGLGQYIRREGREASVIGMIYPDRRGGGYGLSRHQDSPRLDFTRIANESDVHFAHARGFVAKTSAVKRERLRELLDRALVEA